MIAFLIILFSVVLIFGVLPITGYFLKKINWYMEPANLKPFTEIWVEMVFIGILFWFIIGIIIGSAIVAQYTWG